MTTETATFTVGQNLVARDACSSSTRYRFEVVARTACFVTLRRDNGADGEILRVGIKADPHLGEWTLPFGTYSMAPVLRATDEVAPVAGYATEDAHLDDLEA